MQKVLSTMRKAIEKYSLIENGDRIGVGVSGGKDSLVLLKALSDFKKFNLYDFEIVAIHIDMYNGEKDLTELKNFCKNLNVELHIEKTQINDVVFNIRKESNPCSLCAKMRRGALNSICNELNLNKLALAHHLQDVVTTFFLSLFYEGRLSTMLPISHMSRTNITLIRPLYLTHESTIINASKNMPIIKSICPADKNSKRKEIKDLITRLNSEIPDLKKRVETAILSSDQYNLLDKIK